MRKSALEELARIQQQINSLFERALLPSDLEEHGSTIPGTWSPAVDILETEDAYLVHAELPGVRREDMDLTVRDGKLELSGNRPPGEGRHFLRLERSYGPFRRTFPLGEAVDVDGIEASYVEGVLRVRVPKLAARSRRAIAVEES
jgi:HSP20 family protein